MTSLTLYSSFLLRSARQHHLSDLFQSLRLQLRPGDPYPLAHQREALQVHHLRQGVLHQGEECGIGSSLPGNVLHFLNCPHKFQGNMKQHQLTHKIRDGGAGGSSSASTTPPRRPNSPGGSSPALPPSTESSSSPPSVMVPQAPSSSGGGSEHGDPASPASSLRGEGGESGAGAPLPLPPPPTPLEVITGIKRAPPAVDADILTPLPKRLHGMSTFSCIETLTGATFACALLTTVTDFRFFPNLFHFACTLSHLTLSSV